MPCSTITEERIGSNTPASCKAMPPRAPLQATVFFPIPDGTGLLFRLLGRAEAPAPEGTVERTLPAKTRYVELLRVPNWLNR